MRSILLVSPNLEFHQKARRALEGQVFSVTAFSEAEPAIQFLKTQKAELILLDVLMPAPSDGWFLQWLWDQKIKCSILGVCKKSDPALRQSAVDLGVVDLIEQDITEAALRDHVQKIFEGDKSCIYPDFKESKGKILVVDDEEGVRQFLAGFLLDRGYEVFEATNGQECMELVRSQQPSTVFLDINMPGMDGLVTLQAIKQFNPKIGVVMASGIKNPEIVQKAVDLGASHYLLKPFNIQYLEMILLVRLAMAA